MYISIQLMVGEYYNMTSLSTLFGGGSSGGADPLQEGLPVVALYGGDFNQNWDVRLHKVHSGELVGSPWAAITNSTASYAHGQSHIQMFGYNGDHGNLSNQFSSQGYTNYQHFTQSLYQNDHYPYALFGSCSSEGRLGMHSFHTSDYYEKVYRRINVISKKGRRPRRQFNIANGVFTETNFNSNYGLKSSVDLSSTYFTPQGLPTSSSQNYGSACYNQNTKTLAVYYSSSNSTNTGRVYMFRSTLDLMDEATCPTTKDFCDAATINYITTGNVSNWGFNSLNYNLNMMLGDNDHVIFNARNSSSNRLFIEDCSSTSNVTTAAAQPESERSEGNTTSYGPEQGLMYRARMQMSWDGEWVMMYSPYYYYGSGLSAYVISVKNPRKMSYVNITQTSGGGALLPSGRSGFKYLNGLNTDSQPVQSWSLDLSSTGHDHTTNFVYAPPNYTATNDMTSVANWTGTLQNSLGNYAFQYPGYWYSTSYPRFMTVNHWKVEGNYQV